MITNVQECIKPISYIETNAADMMNFVNDKKEPLIITQNGESRAVLIDVESYQEMKDAFSLLKIIQFSEMDVQVGRITIRNQKTRWGSCSAKGNVNFNYQLYYMPPELMDYVIVHELAHRRHMDHSALFWAEVKRYCPDYKVYRNQLKKYETV